MTREEFNKILQDEIEKNLNDFANVLSEREDKKITVEQMVAAAYNMAVTDATASLVATLEKIGVLKYED
ncbi:MULTISPECIES: hypothetical protein [Faecalibacterium]|uniref:hypothetical protein n=1 Tax=Faecalibacterium TaxID=216851 RepID=UPI000E4BCD4F|nr:MULTISPECIES: hypothetical protein [Faecalibacterium]RHQ27671.1 hypothetical protein DWY95_08970 [Faecalibacterium sp. AF28-13AC]